MCIWGWRHEDECASGGGGMRMSVHLGVGHEDKCASGGGA